MRIATATWFILPAGPAFDGFGQRANYAPMNPIHSSGGLKLTVEQHLMVI